MTGFPVLSLFFRYPQSEWLSLAAIRLILLPTGTPGTRHLYRMFHLSRPARVI